jgi:hypothetical protein
MKTFKSFLEEVKKPTGKLKSACWTGYTAVGTKEKNGRTVPNCVPVKEDGMGGGAIGGGGPTNTVSAVAGTGSPNLPADQREPGVSKKRNPVMMGIERRKAPQ